MHARSRPRSLAPRSTTLKPVAPGPFAPGSFKLPGNFGLWRPVPRGLTLIEVLISMFVLSVGLFGVAAMLPLGQRKMLEGVIDQRKAHLAEAAFESLRNHGGLNPSRWVAWDSSSWDGTDKSTGSRVLCRVTSASIAAGTVTMATDAPLAGPTAYYNSYYSNWPCVVDFRQGTLAGTRRLVGGYTAATHTFTIPSMLAAPSSAAPPDTFVVTRVAPFAIDPLMVSYAPSTAEMWYAPGMPRVTLWSTANGAPMGRIASENLCFCEDDLVFDAPAGSLDANQIFTSESYVDNNANGVYDAGDTFTTAQHDTNNNNTWDGGLRRRSLSGFSWAATVIPLVAYQGNVISGSAEYARVAIVIYYKRVLGPSSWTQLSIDLTGGGYGGGGGLLYSPNGSSAQAFADLEPIRAGHWILASSTNVKEFRWYRVETVSDRFQDTGNGSRWTRHITLNGPDWNPSTGGSTIIATYHPSVVGVFERVMRLDSIPERSN